ncbi:MAG: tetratricopeptide repeat protein [Saprospiraceae bacterium]|nr:tetratricopeptide repeat protein [Saprospiraceae bacterium]MBK9722988.1 tetratricopeptide repeat protein [Saprospiraceae bacterium]
MKLFFYISLLFCTLFACTDQAKVSFETPALLERSEKIQYFNEWSEIRTKYADLKHILTKDASKIDALIQLTNLFIAEARVTGEHGHYYPAAMTTITQALNQKNISKDQKFMALSAKASIELSLHNFKEGLKIAQEAITLNPYNAQIYGALVDAYVELGQYDKAIETVDKMVSIRPDLRSYSRVSYLREIYGLPDESIKAMQMAVEAGSPGSEEKSWAALQLAQLCLRYDKVKEAESILVQLLSERPDYPFGKAALADVYLKQNKIAEAEKELKEACLIIPEVGFYVQLAEIYKKEERKNEFDEKIKEIMEMLEDDMKHGHNMSLEYAAIYTDLLENPDKALEYIQQDQTLRPDNIDINRRLAKIYMLKKDKLKAQEFIQKAEKTNSKHPELKILQTALASM